MLCGRVGAKGRRGVASQTGSKSYATWQLNKSQKVDEPKSQRIKNPIERYGRGLATKKGDRGRGRGRGMGVSEECEYVQGEPEPSAEGEGAGARRQKEREAVAKTRFMAVASNKCNVTWEKGRLGAGEKKASGIEDRSGVPKPDYLSRL